MRSDLPPTRDASDPDAGWTVFALGKLGSRELTVHSDLDLVFVYAGETTDAGRSSAPDSRRQSRQDLAHKEDQEDATVGSTRATRGVPKPRQAAARDPLPACSATWRERAETWERMAWTRCRHVGGECRPHDAEPSDTRATPCPVRSRIERELAREAAGDHLDLKRGRGGLADIDFLLQVLQIREGSTRTDFRVAGTRWLLETLPETDFLRPVEADTLRDAYWFLREMRGTDAASSHTTPARRRIRDRPRRGETT
ncbi:Bifunctional glutamine synthetase adenylyltransferase/adenylyl-removing enzyme, partial [Geodia barretti]